MRLLQVLHHELLGPPQAGCDILCSHQGILLAGNLLLPLAEVQRADQLLALLGASKGCRDRDSSIDRAKKAA